MDLYTLFDVLINPPPMWLGVVSGTSGEWSAPVLKCSGADQRFNKWIPALCHCFRESQKSWAGTEMVVWRKLKRRCNAYIDHIHTSNSSRDVWWELLFQLRKSLKKSRRPALGSYESSTDPAHRLLLSDGSGKENQAQDKHVLLSSDDDDFDKCAFDWGTLCACIHSYIINHFRFYSTSSRCKGYTQIYIETVYISCPQTKVRIVYILMYSYYAKHMFISCCTSQEPCPYSLSRGLSYILLYKVIGLTWGEYSDSLHVKIVNSPNIINPLTHYFPPPREPIPVLSSDSDDEFETCKSFIDCF